MSVVCSTCGDEVRSEGSGYEVGRCCRNLPPVWGKYAGSGAYTRSRINDDNASPGDEDDTDDIDDDEPEVRWACWRCETNDVSLYEDATITYMGTFDGGDINADDNSVDTQSNGDGFTVVCSGCGREVAYEQINW